MEKQYLRMRLDDCIPYDNNPRINDGAVDAVSESINQVGYISPIVIDENNIILCGHTRIRSLQSMGIEEEDVLKVSGLTEEQKKKYRLLDNKTNELAAWDFEKLEEELEGLDFEGFDFGFDSMMNDGIDEPEEDKAVEMKDGNYQIIVDCDNEADMEAKYNIILGTGIECRLSTL